MTTPLQRHGDEFVERNTLLHLALGLRAWLARGSRAALAPSREPEADAIDPGCVDAALGLVALHLKVSAMIDEAAASAPPAPPRATPRAIRVPSR
ncbi:MAG: hypothetical protein R3A52_08885 [Polyangiales bacterium]